MADLGQNIRNIVMKGMEAIGNTASSLANSTRSKVDELNLQGQRRELLEKVAETALQMWKDGADFPEEISGDLKEAAIIDEQLKAFRAEKPETEADSEEQDAESSEEAVPADMTEEATADAEAPASPVIDIPVSAGPEANEPETERSDEIPVMDIPEKDPSEPRQRNPLSDAIDELFDKVPPVDQMAEKVNSTLDEMSESLRRFSADFGKKVQDMADQIMKDDSKGNP